MPIVTCLPVEDPGLVCYGSFIGFCCDLQDKTAHNQEVSTIVSQADSFSIFKMAVENMRSI